jgi:hypothetical protein
LPESMKVATLSVVCMMCGNLSSTNCYKYSGKNAER